MQFIPFHDFYGPLRDMGCTLQNDRGVTYGEFRTTDGFNTFLVLNLSEIGWFQS